MEQKRRLAIITTHPIQYNAPLFKQMNERGRVFTIKVFYTWSQSKDKVFDREFGIAVDWDIPLLEGYDYTFVTNTSSRPGTHHFNGITNPTLNDEIEAWKADAILVIRWSFSSHLKAIRHFHRKIKVLFRGDSTLIDEPAGYSLKKMVRRFFLQWIYSHVDYALYVGSASRKYFVVHGLRSRQLLFAPHAIDINRFSDDDYKYTKGAESWRLELGISSNDLVYLFAAKLTRKKDPELLIKAFLALNIPDSWLIIVGNGELEVTLKEKYLDNTKIIFIDFQNQSSMPVVYRLGDVFVLPSRGPEETWGLAINEAMACGRAVIASDKCGCSSDLIVNGVNGYVFENGNLESLKNCMMLSATRYKVQGEHSEQLIKEWSYSKTVDQLEVLFANTL
jgi:glycosyltransferase involved in cell wall biosynthesis